MNNSIKKTIVIVIISLYIGIAVQPSIAKEQPEIFDFKPNYIDKEELIEKINEISQKNERIPMIFYLYKLLENKTFMLTWISLILYAIVVGIGLILYVFLKFYNYYYLI